MAQSSSWLLYKQNYVDKEFERLDLFVLLKERYGIESSLYPGSYFDLLISQYSPFRLTVLQAIPEIERPARCQQQSRRCRPGLHRWGLSFCCRHCLPKWKVSIDQNGSGQLLRSGIQLCIEIRIMLRRQAPGKNFNSMLLEERFQVTHVNLSKECES